MEYGTLAANFSPLVIQLSTQAEIDFFYSLVVQAPDALVGDYVMHEELSELEDFLFENISQELLVEEIISGLLTEGQFSSESHPCKGGCEACAGCNAADSNYEGDVSGFKPFDLRVRTAGEAKLLANLIGACTGEVDRVFDVDTLEMYQPVKAHLKGEGVKINNISLQTFN